MDSIVSGRTSPIPNQEVASPKPSASDALTSRKVSLAKAVAARSLLAGSLSSPGRSLDQRQINHVTGGNVRGCGDSTRKMTHNTYSDKLLPSSHLASASTGLPEEGKRASRALASSSLSRKISHHLNDQLGTTTPSDKFSRDLYKLSVASNSNNGQECNANLAPKKLSKYDQYHHIIFSLGEKPELVAVTQNAHRANYNESKGVSHMSSHVLDISRMTGCNEDLARELKAIPVNDRAADASVKHSKISLTLHGAPKGKMAAKSADSAESERVSSRDIARMLEQHLPVGNYKEKLTIALEACYSAEGSLLSKSALKSLTEELKKSGFEGIRLTGSKAPIEMPYTDSANIPAGSKSIKIADSAYEELEKFSDSNQKKNKNI